MATEKKGRTAIDFSALERDYQALVPVAQRFADEMTHQLDSMITRHGISTSFPIQRRVKAWSSFREKVERASAPLAGVREMQDIVGVRVILQFRRDVDTVCGMLQSAFRIVDRYDTADRLREDQFGYASVHFVVELPDAWLAVPTMAEMGGIRAEVQVRTTAQHIWAAASHVLQYKNEASVPPQVRRAIHRVSALLETVDLEFERVLIERDEYRQKVATEPLPGEVLNVDLLQQILTELWPPENQRPGYPEDHASLLQDLIAFHVTTREQLVDIIVRNLPAVMKDDSERAESLLKQLETASPTETARLHADWVARGVFFVPVGLTRRAMSHEFGARWDDYRRVQKEKRNA